VDAVPYRCAMAIPDEFDDLGSDAPLRPRRGQRALQIAILVILIASMVSLAYVSGRGEVRVTPVAPVVVPPAPSAQAAAPDRARLAVVDGSGHLRTVDRSGGSVISYGRPGTTFSFPAWSPDGTRIAVIGASAGEIDLDVFPVVAQGAGAADPTVVYHGIASPPFYFYWAPDSQRLAFLTTETDGLSLRIAPADGSAPAASIRTGSPMYWAWPGPTSLVVHSGGEGPGAFVGEVGLDGVSHEQRPIDAGGFRAPALTDDGRYRAYVAPGDGTPEQIITETSAHSGRQAVGVFGAAAIGFGPAGANLAFIAPASAAHGTASLPVGPLRLMDARSGAVRTLLPGSVVAYFWSPDGSTLAALEVAAPGDPNVADAGHRGDITLAVATRSGPARFATAAAPAPGLALRLVFLTAGSGAILSQRAVRVSDLFATQLLPYFDQYAMSHLMWSGDGDAIVLPTVADDGANVLSILRPDGSEPRTIAGDVVGFWSP
jgi:WD40-like Beta Propeller Repeat